MTSPAAEPATDVAEDAAAAEQRRRREKAAAAAEARLAGISVPAGPGDDYQELTLVQEAREPAAATSLVQFFAEIQDPVAPAEIPEETDEVSQVTERAEPSHDVVLNDTVDDSLENAEVLLRRIANEATSNIPSTRAADGRAMGFMDMMHHAAEYAPPVMPTPRPVVSSPQRSSAPPIPACPEGVDPAVWAQLPPEARQWAIADPEETEEAVTPTSPDTSVVDPIVEPPVREGRAILGYTSHGPILGPPPPVATAWRGGPEIPGYVGVGSDIHRAETSEVEGRNPLNSTIVEPDSEPAPVETSRGKCVICIDAVADATFVHGETGHTVCCLRCAKQVEELADTCPMCRQPFLMVIKNFTT
eukprot:gnl/MRDRNA2_/MRDRNA2_121228_c0_seq1.p1 gnl/MRDRNA2_/MRDRNA2_121228_c0~~gnl/MRDRNA2_/MRDRNA2_121228_c0_seq1.p1  ORF type:complete len:378 (+),score=93.77 gnl/MRDRNA2_/MRDRNA2_121228_c0_seq1:55-1134(+)